MLSTFVANSSSLSFFTYFLVYLATLVEGPIATLAGGALSSSGLLLPIPVYFSVVLGNLTADLGWYTLGRLGKVNWLARIGSRFGFDLNRIDQLINSIHVHAPRLLFLSKFTTGFPIPALIATGMGKVPVRRWIAGLVLGELTKSAILISAGYFFSRAIDQTQGAVRIILWGTTIILCLGGFVWFKFHKKSDKKFNVYKK